MSTGASQLDVREFSAQKAFVCEFRVSIEMDRRHILFMAIPRYQPYIKVLETL